MHKWVWMPRYGIVLIVDLSVMSVWAFDFFFPISFNAHILKGPTRCVISKKATHNNNISRLLRLDDEFCQCLTKYIVSFNFICCVYRHFNLFPSHSLFQSLYLYNSAFYSTNFSVLLPSIIISLVFYTFRTVNSDRVAHTITTVFFLLAYSIRVESTTQPLLNPF